MGRRFLFVPRPRAVHRYAGANFSVLARSYPAAAMQSVSEIDPRHASRYGTRADRRRRYRRGGGRLPAEAVPGPELRACWLWARRRMLRRYPGGGAAQGLRGVTFVTTPGT